VGQEHSRAFHSPVSAGFFFAPAGAAMRRLRVVRGRRGMTLIEILIVVALLGILAMVVIPKYASARDEARVAAVQEILHSVQAKIAQYHVTNDAWPTTIDAAWFAGGELPDNPFDPDHPIGIKYQGVGKPEKFHPTAKRINPGGSFWYNPDNGRFRARVDGSGTNAETIELYNLVNGSNLTGLNQTAE